MPKKKIILTAILLAGLTVGSFAFISSLVSKPPYHRQTTAQTTASPASKPGFSLRPAATPNTPAHPVSADKKLYDELSDAQTTMEQLRTAIIAADWPAAQNLFMEFNQRTQRLPAPQLNQPDLSPVMQDFFTLFRVELARALREQNEANAQFYLNQLYAIVGEQHARLGTHGLPLELVRLNYLVREVELWTHLGNETLLAERRNALRETWQDLRPIIAARRNGRATATHFDTLVEQVNAVTVPQEMPPIISQCKQDLEQMGALFRRTPGHPAKPATSPNQPSDDE